MTTAVEDIYDPPHLFSTTDSTAKTGSEKVPSSIRNMSYAEIRRCFRQIREHPNMTHHHLLKNGMTAGEFCLRYLLANRVSSEKEPEK